jgi:hypothetical protein
MKTGRNSTVLALLLFCSSLGAVDSWRAELILRGDDSLDFSRL